MEERSFHPLDYVSVLQRRKWWFIVPLVLCVLGGAALAMLLPREYKSYAEIGIADPTLSPELLRGIQSFEPRERQRAISQQLLSRTVLERVVREERLNPGRPVEDVAQGLRARVEQNIEVPKPIGRSSGKDGIESFNLGYVDSSPERAQRIANRLATVFVEENSKVNTQRAENTSEVLSQQLRESQERLSRIQDQLTQKKVAYMGRLPDQTNSNVQTVNGLRQQLDSLSTQIASETQRMSQLESTIEAIKQGVGSGAAAVQGGQARLNQLRQSLATARAVGYTDIHPEIMRIKGEIASAEKEFAARQQAPTEANHEQLLAADPVYRQKVQERNLLQIRINTLRNAEGQARAQITEYQRRVETAPMVEQELSPLTQEFQLERGRYGDLATKYQNAIVVEDLARKQGGERFVVLNPAFLPSAPVRPDLIQLMIMATAMGLVLGAAAVVGREFMDRSVHDARALQSEFEVPVLGEIPRIHGNA
ncbi:MAG: Wzz/FepE/Etk N-terminal domain-containing protein [Vicinamibacterales bacterium]